MNSKAIIKRPNYRRTLITIIGLITLYSLLVVALLRFEVGAPGAKINNLRDALWYMLETLTTVGYGDKMPVTNGGITIGFIVLISSLGVYGFIIGQFANFMSTLKEERDLGLNGTRFKNHVVMIGWNDFGKSVISHIIGAGKQVAVVTKDRPSIDIIREFYTPDQVYTLFSDYHNFDLLEKANLREASIVFINLNDDTEKLVYVINMKKHFQDLNYVVTLENGNLKNTFHSAGVTYAISKNEISSKLLASYIYEPDVALFSEEIIAYAHEDNEYDMKQFRIVADNPFNGMFYDKAFYDLKKECNVVLIGLVKIENGVRKLYKNPENTMKLEIDDYLVMLMDGKGHERLKRLFRTDEGV